MMNLLNEIRTGLANLNDIGTMLRIRSLPDDAPAWIFREGGTFGVAVEIGDDKTVCERFAGSRLATVQRVVGSAECRLLRLESTVESLRNEFASVCAQMVDPGTGGSTRRLVVETPLAWWEKWRQLLGNAVINQSAFSVLGELLAFEELLRRGVDASWRGAEWGTVDIDSPNSGYEVKSTLSRYDSHVHVTGQFQLAGFDNRMLHLIHQRFEPVASGDCVAAVVERLVAAGQNAQRLDELLTRCSLEFGCAARSEGFRLIESKIYKVGADFPKITNSSFVAGAPPPGVIRVEYQIDLAGLASDTFIATSSEGAPL
jgi:hypothetical protein